MLRRAKRLSKAAYLFEQPQNLVGVINEGLPVGIILWGNSGRGVWRKCPGGNVLDPSCTCAAEQAKMLIMS